MWNKGECYFISFSDSEETVLILLKAQLALGASWVSKRDASKALSTYGLNCDEAVKSLERMGYIISVGFKGSHITLTTKGKDVQIENHAKQGRGEKEQH